MFVEEQISILKGLLKDHVTLKTGVMMLKIKLCHHRNKLYFKIYKNIKSYFEFALNTSSKNNKKSNRLPTLYTN